MLESVFTYAEAAPLDEVDEIEMIRLAQAGETEASERLLLAYGPAIRAAVSRFKGGLADGQIGSRAADYGTASFSTDDVQQAAVLGFLECLATHDPEKNTRLAGRVAQFVARAIADETETRPAFRVPERTLSRFYNIVRAADGDMALAEEIAQEKGMSVGVFREVRAAVTASSLQAEVDALGGDHDVSASPVYSASPVVDVEDRILVELAFKAVDDEEARICELAYGFTEYDPVPDAEIAHRLDMTRPTVQRKRGKALDKMRKTLLATPA